MRLQPRAVSRCWPRRAPASRSPGPSTPPSACACPTRRASARPTPTSSTARPSATSTAAPWEPVSKHSQFKYASFRRRMGLCVPDVDLKRKKIGRTGSDFVEPEESIWGTAAKNLSEIFSLFYSVETETRRRSSELITPRDAAAHKADSEAQNPPETCDVTSHDINKRENIPSVCLVASCFLPPINKNTNQSSAAPFREETASEEWVQ